MDALRRSILLGSEMWVEAEIAWWFGWRSLKTLLPAGQTGPVHPCPGPPICLLLHWTRSGASPSCRWGLQVRAVLLGGGLEEGSPPPLCLELMAKGWTVWRLPSCRLQRGWDLLHWPPCCYWGVGTGAGGERHCPPHLCQTKEPSWAPDLPARVNSLAN